MQRDWRNAYLARIDGRPVRCPACGEGDVQLGFIGSEESRLGYAVLWCPKCMKGGYISRVSIPEGWPMLPIGDQAALEREIPKIAFV